MEKKDKSKFFIDGDCTDLAYRNTRDKPHCIQYRKFVEELWSKYKEHADPNCQTDAPKHFLQRFWEMYLGNTFLRRSFKIIKHDKHRGKCPDLCVMIAGHTVWIEAVAPNAGTTKDRVPEIPYFKNPNDAQCFDVPEEKIILRYTNALYDKLKQYRRFCKEGIVQPNDNYIVAINARNIPHAPYGSTIPYFLKALLPFGNLTVAINRTTPEITDSFYTYRDHVEKLNQEKISTKPFLDPAYAGISAILHSSVHCTKHTYELGFDFDILHNPHSKNPLPKEVLSKLSWCTNRFYYNEELNTVEPPAL